jgi:hypothetical protein
MKRTPRLVLALVAATPLLFAIPQAVAAPAGGASGARHGGGHGGYGRHGGHVHSGSYGYGAYWGWGWGLAVGVPWALGWYDPWYWGAPRYAYGPYNTREAAYWCEQDDDCWRERRARDSPPEPTTQIPAGGAIAPGAGPVPMEGMPTERPLHLNYCEASRAYFPAVSTCASGWRMKRSAYD